MSYKKVILKPKKEEALQRFHPWVFSGAIDKRDNGIEEGEIVSIFSSKGDFLAVGQPNRKYRGACLVFR